RIQFDIQLFDRLELKRRGEGVALALLVKEVCAHRAGTHGLRVCFQCFSTGALAGAWQVRLTAVRVGGDRPVSVGVVDRTPGAVAIEVILGLYGAVGFDTVTADALARGLRRNDEAKVFSIVLPAESGRCAGVGFVDAVVAAEADAAVDA